MRVNPSVFEFEGVRFGGQTGPLIVTDFQADGVEVLTTFAKRPHGHGEMVGRQWLGGETWVFEVCTNADDAVAAEPLLDELIAAWRRPVLENEPGKVYALFYEYAGARRFVLGRPTQVKDPTFDTSQRQGVARATFAFRRTDPLVYEAGTPGGADSLHRVTLTVVAESTGGLIEPLAAPLSTRRTTSLRAGLITVAGNAPTPATVTFYGPVTDPWLRIEGGAEFRLNGTLAYDQAVTIDPAAGTILRNDGAAVPGLVAPSSSLRALYLNPGPNELTFSGIDLTGTARVTVAWRDARLSR